VHDQNVGKGDDPNSCPGGAIAMIAPDAQPAAASPCRRATQPHPQQQLLDTMQQLADHPLAEREPAPDEQAFRDAHLFSFGGLGVIPDPEEFPHGHQFYGAIVDERGDKVGYTESVLTWGPDNRLVAAGERLRIREETGRQGGGFGRAYQQHLRERYLNMGIHRKRICAIEHGAYVWATPDTIFDPAQPVAPRLDDDDPRVRDIQWRGAAYASQLWHEFDWRLDRAERDGLAPEGTYAAVKRRFATRKDLEHPTRWKTKAATPWEILQIGRDQTFLDGDGRESWPGKYFLVAEMSRLYEDGCAGRGMVWQGVRLLG